MSSRENEARGRNARRMSLIEVIPGTEVMLDDEQRLHAKGSSRTVLIPQPSSDPKDPLNWSLTWKVLVFTSQWIFTWISVTGALSIAPMFPLLGHEFHLNNSQLSFLTGITVITLGYANFVIVPLSNIYGRRGISLIFGFFIILTCVWEALATSHRSLLAARALNGVVCATSESIMVQVIADMFFLHERGLWTGVYFTGYFLGAFLGPVMSGNIAARYGWRSFFWLETALAGFAVIILIFTFPETKFHRGHRRSPLGSRVDVAVTTTEGRESHERKNVAESGQVSSAASSIDLGAPVGGGRPGRSQFYLLQQADPRWMTFIIRDTLTPIRVFFNPIIFWAGLMLAGPADLVLLWNITESAILAAPPYNWTPAGVGYSNFSFVIGALIGLVTAGPYSDWVAQRRTRRNNFIREAEMRLPSLIPYMIITGLSCIIGGIGYTRSWPWEVILVLGYGTAGLSVTTVPTIAIAYAIDCYKPISGEIMVVATVLKNTLAFSYSYWIFDLAMKTSWTTVAMTVFACAIGPAFLGIPLYYYGKRLRKWTKDSDFHRMEDMI